MAIATFAQALFGVRAADTPLRLAARRPRPSARVGCEPRPRPRHVPRRPPWPRPPAAPTAGAGGWQPRRTRRSLGRSGERVVPAVPGRRKAHRRACWRALPPLRPGIRPRRAARTGGGAAAGPSAPPGRAAPGPRRGGARPALRADGTAAEGPTVESAPGFRVPRPALARGRLWARGPPSGAAYHPFLGPPRAAPEGGG